MSTKNLYTFKQWTKDGDFKARPGQEVAADVYAEMKQAARPIRLSTKAARNFAAGRTGGPIIDGFLVGRAADEDGDGDLYHAFTKRMNPKARYFYAGLMHRPERETGLFYQITGADGAVSESFVKNFLVPDEMRDDARAARESLFELEYKDGEIIRVKKIYDPTEDTENAENAEDAEDTEDTEELAYLNYIEQAEANGEIIL